MPLTPPETTPEWASSGSAEIATPNLVVRQHGWTHQIPPAVQWVNWWFNLVWQWITYLSGRTKVYATLEDATEDLESGDVCIVDEHVPGTAEDLATLRVGTPVWSKTRTEIGTSVDDVAVDGRYVYVLRGTTVKVLARADGSTVRTDTLTSTGTAVRIVCDGVYYVVAIGNKVECRAAATGTSVFVYDHGAVVNDVALVGLGLIVMVGEAGTDTYHARGLDPLEDDAGRVIWNRKHSNTGGHALYAVSGWGNRVVVAGDGASYIGAATTRCLNAADGNDDTTDGGSSVDAYWLTWHNATATVEDAGVIAVDESAVYIGGSDGTLTMLSLEDGSTVTTWTLPEPIRRVAVDHRFVYAGCNDNSGTLATVLAISKRTLARAWRAELTSKHVTGLAADGAGLFQGMSASTGSEPVMRRLALTTYPTTFRRIDPRYDQDVPCRRLIVPAEE